jgi:GTP-binding protein
MPVLIKNATFITSAAKADQFITPQKPMIAVCGKSNVGKSSFINMLANRKKLAKTSSEPGRTRLVNYFDFGEFVLADLPGYGFARVSKSEKIKWAKTLDDFFKQKENISHVFMLVDSRHDATADDVQMMEYLHFYTLPFTVVLTKSDKISRMKIKEHKKAIAAD